jgi:hypothetical protein
MLKLKKRCRDYPHSPFDIPIKMTHLCYNGNEVELVKYGRRVLHDNGDEEVFEEYFECPSCLQEKLFKHHEEKLTLFSAERLALKYEILEKNLRKLELTH